MEGGNPWSWIYDWACVKRNKALVEGLLLQIIVQFNRAHISEFLSTQQTNQSWIKCFAVKRLICLPSYRIGASSSKYFSWYCD